jgi:hypothetical protein
MDAFSLILSKTGLFSANVWGFSWQFSVVFEFCNHVIIENTTSLQGSPWYSFLLVNLLMVLTLQD